MTRRYWTAHSDLDWYFGDGNPDDAPDDDRCALSATARRGLLHQAKNMLERAERHERWGMSAMDYCWQAAGFLRLAGLPALADECSDEFGCDVAAVVKAIDRELSLLRKRIEELE